jgi:hypothetical protein
LKDSQKSEKRLFSATTIIPHSYQSGAAPKHLTSQSLEAFSFCQTTPNHSAIWLSKLGRTTDLH